MHTEQLPGALEPGGALAAGSRVSSAVSGALETGGTLAAGSRVSSAVGINLEVVSVRSTGVLETGGKEYESVAAGVVADLEGDDGTRFKVTTPIKPSKIRGGVNTPIELSRPCKGGSISDSAIAGGGLVNGGAARMVVEQPFACPGCQWMKGRDECINVSVRDWNIGVHDRVVREDVLFMKVWVGSLEAEAVLTFAVVKTSHDIPFAHGVRTPHDKGIMPAANTTLANLLCLQCSAMLRAPAHHLPCCTSDGSSEGLLSSKSFPTIYNASCEEFPWLLALLGLLQDSHPRCCCRCSRSRTDGADKKGFSTESSLTCSMNLLQEDKHYRYLSDEELDAILPATGHRSKQLPYPGSSDSAAAGADDTMGAVDDDFQWETVPADLRHNEMFALAVWDVLVVGDIIFNVLASS
ncbi:hypothetical protein EDB19DRAFT_1829739 [Suillus lakei]|nr:hypothetical protein EDB19DRAFT_1829739 [Suillus lakei]